MEIATIICLMGKLTPMIAHAIDHRAQIQHKKKYKKDIDTISSELSNINNYLSNISNDLQIINNKLDKLTNWSINQLSQRGIIIFQILHELSHTSNTKLIEKQLDLVYNHSIFLITLEKDNILFDTPEKKNQVQNLNCVGYWGLYIYFRYYSEQKCINNIVYSCISKYPLLGGTIFPAIYFEKEVPTFCKIQEYLKAGISFNNINIHDIDIFKQYDKFTPNIATPLLEIHFEEEIDRLQTFATNKLKEE